MNKKMIQEYSFANNRKVFFSPYLNRFWVDTLPKEIIPDYYDTTLVKIRLEITYLCNGNCSYCIVFGNKIEKIESMRVEESWNWFKEQSWFNDINEIFIIGGEPLICFSDIEFLMNNFDGKIKFSTNGTLLTPEMAKKLSRHNVFVYISLDGPHYQDNLMRVYNDGNYMYDDIMRGVHLLMDAGVKYGFFMVATRDNVYNIADVMEEIDKKFHPLKIGYSMPHWTENGFDEISGEEYKEALVTLYKNRKRIKTEVMQLGWRINPILEGKVKKFSCALHTSQITLLPDLTSVRCSKLDNDEKLRNITKEELNEGCPISLAENNIQPCASCIALGSCGGGCPFDGLKRFNGVIDKRECIITPEIVSMVVNEVIAGLEKIENIPSGLLAVEIIREILKND